MSCKYWLQFLISAIISIYSPTSLPAIGLIGQDQNISTITIHNKKGGEIQYYNKRNGKAILIGTVLSPAINPQFEPFSAFRWGKDSAIVATSVNIIRIRISGVRGFSICPINDSPGVNSDFDEGFSKYFIKTDIVAGTKLFSEYAPPVGSSIYLIKNGNEIPFPPFHDPEVDDICQIYFNEPKIAYKNIIIENLIGGSAYGIPSTKDGRSSDTLAKIVKTVEGVGRFGGSKFAGIGEVRANHPGVICISTSKKGEMGGFQIIPDEHADDAEMKESRLKPQWMILKSMNKNCLAGSFPLFSGLIRPGDKVQYSKDSKNWLYFPNLEGKIDDALSKIGMKYLKISISEIGP